MLKRLVCWLRGHRWRVNSWSVKFTHLKCCYCGAKTDRPIVQDYRGFESFEIKHDPKVDELLRNYRHNWGTKPEGE